MAILSPKHLLEQADFLLARSRSDTARQVDLRRAISAAYYAVFHHILISVGDEFVGKRSRNDQRYALVYRSVDHGAIKRLCDEVSRASHSPKYRKFIPNGWFEQYMRNFSVSFIGLQRFRHEADYSPSSNFSVVDVQFAVMTASIALRHFDAADPEQRKLFLTLLAFPPR